MLYGDVVPVENQVRVASSPVVTCGVDESRDLFSLSNHFQFISRPADVASDLRSILSDLTFFANCQFNTMAFTIAVRMYQ